ncbi:DNA cytosine methyltransferase [Parvimonas parva]|uniref:Cytosine-specific methyltransferase n=4 Tax=Parvimonas TaxID=543311 RepID=A0ABS1CBY7_9FIRM|nr:DNA (cytosine-5-)-methyltransferase [Parvimonas parva]MBK1469022.1 DNA (cytosine-5-)-methyltransferase [Parvimonas parva]
MEQLKVVELFGGIGAIRKALERQKFDFKVVDYVENNKFAVDSYNALFNEEYYPSSVVRYEIDMPCDFLFHGSPCQDFSIIGRRQGGKKDSKTRSSLLFETIRILKEMKYKPRWVIWENVKGALSEEYSSFSFYLKEMEKLGYQNKFEILNSIDFGIPQKRERVFVISFLGKNEFDFSKLEKKKMEKLEDFLQSDFDEKYIVTQKSILDCIGKKTTTQKRARIIKDYVYTIMIKQVRLPNSGLVDLKNGKYRFLTERECFRLMGFDDEDFERILKVVKIDKNKLSSNLYKLAGNSIVVNVLEAILKEIRRLEDKDEKISL